MAPLPKKKHTKSRAGKRRGAHKLSLPTLSPCPNCKKLREPHKACPYCGYYGKAGYSK